MAVPVFRAAGTKGAGTGATSIPLPAGLVANDICILTATTIAGGTITITTAGSITWTAVSGSPIDVTGGEKLYMWWGRYASGSTAPTLTPGSDHVCGGIAAYSGCVGSGTPIEATATGSETTSDTSFSFATGVSTTGADRLVLVACTSGVDSNTGQFSGAFTNTSLTSIATRINYGTTSGGGGGFGLAQGARAASGTTGTWAETLAGASPKAYLTLALIPSITVSITVQDAFHGLISDSPTVTQTHNVTVSDPFHALNSDIPTVTQTHNLTVQDAFHSSSADNVTVSLEGPTYTAYVLKVYTEGQWVGGTLKKHNGSYWVAHDLKNL